MRIGDGLDSPRLSTSLCSWPFWQRFLPLACCGERQVREDCSVLPESMRPTPLKTAYLWSFYRTFWRIRLRLRGVSGQLTVEAPVLLGVLMLLFVLLLQPVCLLYTRMVMGHAAAETARVLATSADENAARMFALRRLEAIPGSSLFHVGERAGWEIRTVRDVEEGYVSVGIVGHAKPLPLFGELVGGAFDCDGEGVRLSVEVVERVRPEWLEGDYGQWMSEWRR